MLSQKNLFPVFLIVIVDAGKVLKDFDLLQDPLKQRLLAEKTYDESEDSDVEKSETLWGILKQPRVFFIVTAYSLWGMVSMLLNEVTDGDFERLLCLGRFLIFADC
jgi:hypothetical protein